MYPGFLNNGKFFEIPRRKLLRSQSGGLWGSCWNKDTWNRGRGLKTPSAAGCHAAGFLREACVGASPELCQSVGRWSRFVGKCLSSWQPQRHLPYSVSCIDADIRKRGLEGKRSFIYNTNILLRYLSQSLITANLFYSPVMRNAVSISCDFWELCTKLLFNHYVLLSGFSFKTPYFITL